jgi:hypothetical protein
MTRSVGVYAGAAALMCGRPRRAVSDIHWSRRRRRHASTTLQVYAAATPVSPGSAQPNAQARLLIDVPKWLFETPNVLTRRDTGFANLPRVESERELIEPLKCFRTE